MNKYLIDFCLLICLTMSANFALAEPTQDAPPTLAKGADYDVLKTKCRICHALSLITEQRIPLVDWQQEINKMVGWGAPLNADEAKSLAVYLSKQLPVDLPAHNPPLVDTPNNAMSAGDR